MESGRDELLPETLSGWTDMAGSCIGSKQRYHGARGSVNE